MVIFPEYEDVLSLSGAVSRKFSCVVTTHTLHKHYALHHHDVLELSLVVSGTGTEFINGSPHKLQPRTVTFLRPHDMHEIFCDDTGVEVICCMFDISLLFGSTMEAEFGTIILGTNDGSTSYVDLDPHSYAEMRACLEKMRLEFQEDKLAKNSYIRSKLIEALIIYFRAHQSRNNLAPTSSNYRNKKLIWNVIQYVNTHYINDLSLEILSTQFDTSVSAISLAFKEVMGTTFLQYLHSLRIRRATGLLLNTSMSILDVSLEAGFQSFRTFSRVFMKIEGISPREYRLKYSREPVTSFPLSDDSMD
ncbi:AraC family transcriptional regulator [Paenibacillus sp. FJAT-27812]|uniref:AraC family transcriptional regulator n=1 Tax=Paenibacillus sp. FJAT-27812 TaxID=1684143 RepID=UPI0006A761E3|nr:AraC family transcriptional regulator [Paenibacillus sp. FJAT-27812]